MRGDETLSYSIFDRLVDTSHGVHRKRSEYSERDLIRSISRELESLLNSRQTYLGLEAYPELQKTIIGYGLPDENTFDLETPDSRFRFAQTIESVIEEFEPRVKNVFVEIEEDGKHSNNLRLLISATLNIQSGPQVVFDTTLQLATGQYTIKSTEY